MYSGGGFFVPRIVKGLFPVFFAVVFSAVCECYFC
jgi:hypothetical protein